MIEIAVLAVVLITGVTFRVWMRHFIRANHYRELEKSHSISQSMVMLEDVQYDAADEKARRERRLDHERELRAFDEELGITPLDMKSGDYYVDPHGAMRNMPTPFESALIRGLANSTQQHQQDMQQQDQQRQLWIASQQQANRNADAFGGLGGFNNQWGDKLQ